MRTTKCGFPRSSRRACISATTPPTGSSTWPQRGTSKSYVVLRSAVAADVGLVVGLDSVVIQLERGQALRDHADIPRVRLVDDIDPADDDLVAHVDPRALPFAGAMPTTIFTSDAPFDGASRCER